MNQFFMRIHKSSNLHKIQFTKNFFVCFVIHSNLCNMTIEHLLKGSFNAAFSNLEFSADTNSNLLSVSKNFFQHIFYAESVNFNFLFH